MTYWRLGRLAAALGLVGLCSVAQAASLSVNPVIVNLDSSQSIGALRLRNRSDRPVVMQAAVRDWNVVDGADSYSDTDALIVTPPVFTVEPGGVQVVRVGLRQPAPSRVEQAFRVFLEQAPAAPAQNGESSNGVHIMLKLGIPVFIGQKDPTRRQVAWHTRAMAGEKLRLSARNQGNVHVKIRRLALLDGQGNTLVTKKTLTYLLPGSTRGWTLRVPRQAEKPYQIKAWTEGRALQARTRPSQP